MILIRSVSIDEKMINRDSNNEIRKLLIEVKNNLFFKY